MVTHMVYNVLARRDFPDNLRRAFLAILAEYDLTDFVTINVHYMTMIYDFDIDAEFTQAITHFVNAGVLESGPRVNFEPTYRIRPEFVASRNDIDRLQKRVADRKRREALIARRPA
jgi:hypothetical protein